jgi:hypothetical protein
MNINNLANFLSRATNTYVSPGFAIRTKQATDLQSAIIFLQRGLKILSYLGRGLQIPTNGG